MNLLYYGDNLDVLRRHVESESIDLVYLDQPLNSNVRYNLTSATTCSRSETAASARWKP